MHPSLKFQYIPRATGPAYWVQQKIISFTLEQRCLMDFLKYHCRLSKHYPKNDGTKIYLLC